MTHIFLNIWKSQKKFLYLQTENEKVRDMNAVSMNNLWSWEEAMSDLDESEKEFERGDVLTDEEFNTKCQALIDSFLRN